MSADIQRVAEKIVEWQDTHPTMIFSVEGIKNIMKKEMGTLGPIHKVPITSGEDIVCAGEIMTQARGVALAYKELLQLCYLSPEKVHNAQLLIERIDEWLLKT